MLTSKELAEQSGATFRQIDYWCREGIISPIGENTPGSGQRRTWEEKLVGPVRVMSNLTKTFGRRSIPLRVLKEVHDAYIEGYESLDLGNGIILSWE